MRMDRIQAPIVQVMGDLIRQVPGTISLGQGVVHYGPPAAAIEAARAALDLHADLPTTKLRLRGDIPRRDGMLPADSPDRQDVTRRGRGAREEPDRPSRRSSQLCQTTSSGDALKIEEYVPEMIPISRARTKFRIAEPPKR